jgi:excisionase family DNA binding protein
MQALRVLTATEVASVLRVEEDVITTAIRDGELPGNRVGDYWRVDQSALARWLRGKYGELSDAAGPPTPTEPETGPT